MMCLFTVNLKSIAILFSFCFPGGSMNWLKKKRYIKKEPDGRSRSRWITFSDLPGWTTIPICIEVDFHQSLKEKNVGKYPWRSSDVRVISVFLCYCGNTRRKRLLFIYYMLVCVFLWQRKPKCCGLSYIASTVMSVCHYLAEFSTRLECIIFWSWNCLNNDTQI